MGDHLTDLQMDYRHHQEEAVSAAQDERWLDVMQHVSAILPIQREIWEYEQEAAEEIAKLREEGWYDRYE